jgi:hypothetical protein
MKLCPACEKYKNSDSFYNSTKTKDGLYYRCKECSVSSVSVKDTKELGKTKKCNACLLNKDLIYFYKDKRNIDGLFGKCKKCVDEKIPRKGKVFISEDGLKKCTTCKILKPVECFNKNKTAKCGLNYSCKECVKNNTNKEWAKNYRKTYYENNKVTIGLESKVRYEKNKEVISKKQSIYNRKESSREKRKKAREKRILSNPLEKIKSNCRGLICKTFRNLDKRKSKKTEDILGCTFMEFKQHIESQFLPWMNWENYGNVCETLDYNCSWDLDHIIPISYAKTEEEVYLLNHWSNFQPLCSKINRDIKKALLYPCTNLELNITKI